MRMKRTSMKGKLILLSILFFGFLGYVVVRFFLMDRKNEFGQVKIVSSPEANVFLETVNIGKTPYDDKMRVGEYLIKLIPNKEATATASWQGKVVVHKNAVTYINRELGVSDIYSAGEILTIIKASTKQQAPDSGEVQVETDPVGALVYLDNDEKGVAPLLLQEVPKGAHDLSIYMPGFFRRTIKINVESDHQLKAVIKLALDAEAQKELQATSSAKVQVATPSAIIKDDEARTTPTIVIKETPTGWLRVRYEPTLTASEAARVNPGEKYSLLEERTGWIKIPYAEGQEGWIASQYAEKVNE